MSPRSEPWTPLLLVVVIVLIAAVGFAAMGSWMGGGWGWSGMMGFGALWMLVPALLLVVLIFALTQQHRGGGDGEDARSVLERRYAAGEIGREEYLQKRDDITGGKSR